MSTAAAPQLLPFHTFDFHHRPSNDSPRIQYSPLSSGLPSPSFPSPIPLPRGRSPTPATSRQPSRQLSVRRLSSIVHSRPPSAVRPETPRADVFDVLGEGDIIGQGLNLHGEPIELVNIASSASRHPERPPASRFQVIRKLGTGSYAVVYLVREVFEDDAQPDSPSSPHGYPEELLPLPMRTTQSYPYARHFAVKCLSKANLSPEELEVQMFEATLHQSLPSHSNIVTLYQSFQTPSYLLLLLESVPGEDLFYFLEQSRDQHPNTHDLDERSPSSPSDTTSHTPPTPSLLSTLHPTHLLSYQRIKLITSMFAQMCTAVATCHEQGVSHRDIKPENFIVTEGWKAAHGPAERRVLVKLTDFGLATLQMESADVDCGSAPYMSYECRNNVAPTYATQPADVWSLGIVLINMLYHHNPWSDTAFIIDPVTRRATFTCPSFASFLSAPIPFFLQRFPGMTLPVAEFLANKVFCLLSPPATMPFGGTVRSQRVTAREFGEWVRALPHLMGQGASSLSSSMGLSSPMLYPSTPGIFSPVMSRSGSVNHAPPSLQMIQQPLPIASPTSTLLLSPVVWPLSAPAGYASLPISSPLPPNLPLLPPSTPSSSAPPVAPSPARMSLSMPHPPMSPVPESEVVDGAVYIKADGPLGAQDSIDPSKSSLALDLDGPQAPDSGGEDGKDKSGGEAGPGGDDGISFRSVSTKRRGKRGARRKAQQNMQKEEDLQNKLDYLAGTFEQLAREISRTTTTQSNPATPLPGAPVALQDPSAKLPATTPPSTPPILDGGLPISSRLRNSPSRLSVSTNNSLTTTSVRSAKTTSTTASTKSSSSADRALAKMPPPPSMPPPVPPIPSALALQTLAKSMSITEERERAQRASNRSRSFTTNVLPSSTSLASSRKSRIIPPPPSGPPPSLPPHMQHLQSTYASPLAMSKSPSTLPNALSPLSQSVTVNDHIAEEQEPGPEYSEADNGDTAASQPAESPASATPTQQVASPYTKPTPPQSISSVSSKKSWKGMFGLYSSSGDPAARSHNIAPPAVVTPGLTSHVTNQLQALQSTHRPLNEKSSSKSLTATPSNSSHSSASVSHVSRLMSDLDPVLPPVPKAVSNLSKSGGIPASGSERGRRTDQYTAPVPFTRHNKTSPNSSSRWPDRSPIRSSESSNWRASTSPPANNPLSSASTASFASHQSAAPSIVSGASSIMSSTGTISSASSGFSTRFSNSSRMSVSTIATSVSGTSGVMKYGTGRGGAGSMYIEKGQSAAEDPSLSWRPVDRDRPDLISPPPRPRHIARATNVKKMDGMPNNLDEPPFPRTSRLRSNGFDGSGHERKKSQPPPITNRGGKAAVMPLQAPTSLDTINEQRISPAPSTFRSSESKDSVPSETASVASVNDSHSSASIPETKKIVQKGQINSLAKMLSTFKTKGRD